MMKQRFDQHTLIMYVRLFITVSLFHISSTSTVRWLQRSVFNLPQNFENGQLPCSKQTVVFPNSMNADVRIVTDTEVNGFILPIDGDIELDASILFNTETEENNCAGGYTNFLGSSGGLWNQADVWSSEKFNKATPDSERVPCFDDIVEFPSNTLFTVHFPEVKQNVKGVKVDGEIYTSSGQFMVSLYRKSMSRNRFIVGRSGWQYLNINANKQCFSRAGCPCQDVVLDIDCTVKFCSIPTCSSPVKPEGNCCKICGGFLVFDIDQNFEMMEFENLVKQTVDSYGKDRLEYHIGRIPNNKVQVVVVETGDYEGLSSEAVTDISYWLQTDWVSNSKKLSISGAPLSKAGMQIKIMFGMLVAVILMMTSLYLYYYKLPQIRTPLWRSHGRGMISRFQRRTDSVVSLTRRDSGVAVSAGPARAFRNPLYDSKRGRVIVDESILEE